MLRSFVMYVTLLATMVAAATLAAASPAPTSSAVPADAAVIVNSGSTNTSPYQIVVRPAGSARVQFAAGAPQTKKLSADLAKTFFADLRAAMPLDRIKTEPCAKSASFGTSLVVRYRGTRSPDLSCSSDDAGRRVMADVAKITDALGVNALRRYGGTRMPHLLPQPTPTP